MYSITIIIILLLLVLLLLLLLLLLLFLLLLLLLLLLLIFIPFNLHMQKIQEEEMTAIHLLDQYPEPVPDPRPDGLLS